jgi:hypothetical protein
MNKGKIKIPFKNEMVDGVEVSFKTKIEEWNEYELEDGEILRFKSVVTSIARTEAYNDYGQPVYAVKSENVASVKNIPNKFMKRKK